MSTRVSKVQNNGKNSAIARVQISPFTPRNDRGYLAWILHEIGGDKTPVVVYNTSVAKH